MSSSSVERYPIDFEVLKAGDVISTETLQHSIGLHPGHPRWSLKLLGFREQIETQRPDLVARIHRDTVRVMIAEEADHYLFHAARNRLSGFMRNVKKRDRIDYQQIEAGEKRKSAEMRTIALQQVAQVVRSESRKTFAELKRKLLQ